MKSLHFQTMFCSPLRFYDSLMGFSPAQTTMTNEKDWNLRPPDCPPLLKPIPDTFNYPNSSQLLIPSLVVKSPVFASASPCRRWPVVFLHHKLTHNIKSLLAPKLWHPFLTLQDHGKSFPSCLLSILQAIFMCVRACTCHEEVYLIIKMASLWASPSCVEISKCRIALLRFSHVYLKPFGIWLLLE